MKPPYTKWINDIKTKLGFNRTMTASGEDVVDAINKQSQQIGDLGTALTAVGECELIGSTNSNSFVNFPFPSGKSLNDYRFFLFCSKNQSGAMFHPSIIPAGIITIFDSGVRPILDYFTDGANNMEMLLVWNASNQQISGLIMKTDGTAVENQALYVYGIK